MRVAVTAAGPELSSVLDGRFGRAAYLLVVDLPERTVSAVPNQEATDAAQGAGIRAGQNVIDSGATQLVTGHCGPKAYRALKAAGIDVLLTQETTVEAALHRLEAGDLATAVAADVDGHW